ncbi:putative ABC transporter permease protein YtcP [Paenibacillus dendritiformis]|uniref:carbohydrate ABC transporter permease n=2 Tax=Paenibacillus TaxID=44249 RepID=UPI00143D0A8B|nr:carbohydrate ABC transporter permease [Paenibacillus dendritiformis]NKI23883.1 carbohydrate ABC transporter permease [Paenibacillus dendritiformis]NRG00404.1 carbohydrate ABC transporter permease [Paenibacillus dendritiformis]GIO72036.1 putative ABC transporter permease protein YtcP [Paenibacillus dendritiformis]
MSLTIGKKSIGEKVFDTANVVFLILFSITAVYPFLNVMSISFSTSSAANAYGLKLWPQEVSLDGYRAVFANKLIWTGYYNTIFRTVLGTFLNVIFSVMCAYPLSKKYLPHRNLFTAFIVFTMFFSGGLIPNYLLIKELGLLDSRWSLILPGLIAAFTMIIVRNYFMSLPEEVEESARIDGANDMRILFSIVLPMSMPIIATISLWYAVAHWNAWFDSLLYISDPNKAVLGNVLRKIVIEGSSQFQQFDQGFNQNGQTAVTPDIIKAATIMVATVPIICVYPFVQKYFVKGVIVGSLKG